MTVENFHSTLIRQYCPNSQLIRSQESVKMSCASGCERQKIFEKKHSAKAKPWIVRPTAEDLSAEGYKVERPIRMVRIPLAKMIEKGFRQLCRQYCRIGVCLLFSAKVYGGWGSLAEGTQAEGCKNRRNRASLPTSP